MSVSISAIVKMKRTSTKINNIMANKYSDVLSANLVPLRPSSLRDVDEPDPYYHSSWGSQRMSKCNRRQQNSEQEDLNVVMGLG